MILGGQTDDFRVDRQVTLGDEQMTFGTGDMKSECQGTLKGTDR